ncbi:hypothetical protein KBJ94_29260 [Pseudomonas sp. ITA]|uniref:hypothetical protein n=1 Tax=Pseudomonas sp. ITA TaxID=2825841 RepID=UPI002495ABAD|nr:hypothetical protein [Pseudomonas sp. ITA]MDI2146139.1 hypothetical protein [Pseudomonas sp. ITA]
MLTLMSPVGPSTEKLKDVFGPQQVPLASNFSDFIDIADVGRKAAGLSPDQPQGQGLGLQLDQNLKLAVLAQTAGGLNVNAAGVGITVEAGGGLIVGADGLALAVEANKGLVVGTNGVAIQPDNGINLSATGIGIVTESGKGLTVGPKGIAVQPGNGIEVSPTGVGVTPGPNKGLMVDGSGVGVIANTASGIKVDGNGVGLIDDVYIKIFCSLHSALFYGVSELVAAFVTRSSAGFMCAYFYGRNGAIPLKDDEFTFSIRGVQASHLQYSNDTGYNYNFSQVFTATWQGFSAAANDQMSVPVLLGDQFDRGVSTFSLQAV